ncbi:MAG: hypothetical protein KDE01_09950, partial [Caldilineaceae bacterium]|nr:hypothetical protein [Caldilineaceae bacterium]
MTSYLAPALRVPWVTASVYCAGAVWLVVSSVRVTLPAASMLTWPNAWPSSETVAGWPAVKLRPTKVKVVPGGP